MQISVATSLFEEIKAKMESNPFVTEITRTTHLKAKEEYVITFKLKGLDNVPEKKKVRLAYSFGGNESVQTDDLIFFDESIMNKLQRIHFAKMMVLKISYLSRKLFYSINWEKANTIVENCNLKKKEGSLIVLPDMWYDTLVAIVTYGLCQVNDVRDGGDCMQFIISDNKIDKYKMFDILIDKDYAVVYEKSIDHRYGVNWKSYTALYFCKKLGVKVLTNDVFEKKQFERTILPDTTEIKYFNFDVVNIITEENLIKHGFLKSKIPGRFIFRKNECTIYMSEDGKQHNAKISGVLKSFGTMKTEDINYVLKYGKLPDKELYEKDES